MNLGQICILWISCVYSNRKYKNINCSPWIQTQEAASIATIQEALANISKICVAIDPQETTSINALCSSRDDPHFRVVLDSIAFLYTAIIVARWRQGYGDAERAGKRRVSCRRTKTSSSSLVSRKEKKEQKCWNRNWKWPKMNG